MPSNFHVIQYAMVVTLFGCYKCAMRVVELAASDEDFDSSQILLASFGPADTMITVNVSIFEDHLVENDEMFQLLINLPSSAEMLGIAKGTPHITDVVIIDDDSELLYLGV